MPLVSMLPTNQQVVHILFVGMRETNRWSSLGWQPLVGGILRLGTYTVLGEPVKLSLLFYCRGQTIGISPCRGWPMCPPWLADFSKRFRETVKPFVGAGLCASPFGVS